MRKMEVKGGGKDGEDGRERGVKKTCVGVKTGIM